MIKGRNIIFVSKTEHCKSFDLTLNRYLIQVTTKIKTNSEITYLRTDIMCD